MIDAPGPLVLIITNYNVGDPFTYAVKVIEALNRAGIAYIVATSMKDTPHLIKTYKHRINRIIIAGSFIRFKKTELPPTYVTPCKYEHDLYCLHHLPNVPAYGICFGCQLLMQWYGGGLIIEQDLYQRDLPIEFTPGHFMFKNAPRDYLYRVQFHDLPSIYDIDRKNADVKEIAWFDYKGQRRACAFEFAGHSYGSMFHPEKEVETHQILLNFVRGGGGGVGQSH